MKNSCCQSLTVLMVFLLLIAFSAQTKAQDKIQIFGLAGYQTNSNVTVAEGELNIKDDLTYGFGLSYDVDRQTKMEISWSMSPTTIELNQYLGSTIPVTDVYIHHFQGGAVFEPKKEKVSPFGLFSLGATMFHPTKENLSDEVRFSIAFGGGVKVYLSDKVGLRFQGRVIIPMSFAGGSMWVGTGGAGVSVGAYTYFVEADFTGGLFIRL